MGEFGFATYENRKFEDDGNGKPAHSNEDIPIFQKLHDPRISTPCYLLGIIDGHEGDFAARFVFDQLYECFQGNWYENLHNDELIFRFLHYTLLTIDNKFLNNVSRTESTLGNQALTPEDELHEVESSERQERKKKCGCAVVLALIYNQKLYVANIGDCLGILCKTDGTTESLTFEHSLLNESEVNRLIRDCRLTPDLLRKMGDICKYNHTRSIGDYNLKLDYPNTICFKNAISPPIIAKPQLVTPLTIDPSWQYLILTSSGVCRLVHQLVYDRDRVGGEISHILNEAARVMAEMNLTEISKAVVSELCNKCYQAFLSFRHSTGLNQPEENSFSEHDDLSILIFKFPRVDTPSNQNPTMTTSSELWNTGDSNTGPPSPIFPTMDNPNLNSNPLPDVPQNPIVNIERPSAENTNSSSHNSEDVPSAAYVDFSGFDQAISRLSIDQVSLLNALLNAWQVDVPDSSVHTIPEEHSMEISDQTMASASPRPRRATENNDATNASSINSLEIASHAPEYMCASSGTQFAISETHEQMRPTVPQQQSLTDDLGLMSLGPLDLPSFIDMDIPSRQSAQSNDSNSSNDIGLLDPPNCNDTSEA